MKQTVKKCILLSLIVCIAFCLNGCNFLKKEDTSSKNPVHEKEMTEEEKVESVYRDGIKTTFCIFTSNGNNGTGFLYKEKYVVTNSHVVYDADSFNLSDAKGQKYKGTVIFADIDTDIAIIQVDNYKGESVKFGNSDSVSVKERLVLIGNPVDGEPFSFCTGKRVELEKTLQQKVNSKNMYIPVDANIVSGYSGGPVFNLSGELIGISNATYIGDLSAYEFDYLSLIIPINRVKELIETNCV